MRRGTTSTLKFKLPFDTGVISVLNVAFEQRGSIVLEKTLSDCILSGDEILCPLSESDTLKLNGSTHVKIQLRIKKTNGDVVASDILEGFVERIIKDGELT